MSKENTPVSFVKIGMVYTISNLVVKGIAFLTTPIFTRLMTQSDFGHFNSIASWANIISIIVTLGLYSSISRAKYDYKNRITEYMSTITILGSIITAVCWIVIESKMTFFENLFSMDKLYIRSIMLYSMFSPAPQILMAKHRMFNEYKQVVAITWITLLASTGASLGFVFFMDNKLTGRVIGNYMFVAIIDIIFWLLILIRGKSFSIQHCKYACILSIPLILHELSGILLNSSDRIIINQLCGSVEAALYSLAYTIGMIITMLSSSLNQAWVPWFYDNLETKQIDRIRSVTKIYTFAFSVGCIFLMLIGPEMILIFGGKKYVEAACVIPPVCMAVELQFLYTFYVNIEFFLKKTLYISLATTGATIINILLNYLLIPQFGYIMAAYTTIVGYFFMLVLHWGICKKTKYKDLFEEKWFIINLFVCLIGMILTLIIYNCNIIRILLMIIILATVIIVIIKNQRKILDAMGR